LGGRKWDRGGLFKGNDDAMGNGPAHVAKTGRFLSNWQRTKSEILALTSDFRISVVNALDFDRPISNAGLAFVCINYPARASCGASNLPCVLTQ